MGEPVDDRVVVAEAAVASLSHARDDEDLIVHRETKQHREDKERHPALNLADVIGAEQRGAHAEAKDGDQHAVAGGHGR